MGALFHVYLEYPADHRLDQLTTLFNLQYADKEAVLDHLNTKHQAKYCWND